MLEQVKHASGDVLTKFESATNTVNALVMGLANALRKAYTLVWYRAYYQMSECIYVCNSIYAQVLVHNVTS
ncbi:hypothetical protein AG1IA_06363 [Rhizoctonia solani AG-1 IA]|uniref:Uncharacterized protein n=1 Tax=Thanatephorus cucumeris (strain AG1-IA) TaxID=983506 RepID=L8WN67_THACA|nr:hypothetical protein AG1IA_06363 [Rhizoctonia solani AG-1 IA]